jgi:flavodoxin
LNYFPNWVFLVISTKALVFFSRNGSTKLAATILAARVDAELIELKEKKPVKGFLRSGYLALKAKSTPLADAPWEKCADKDILILGTPIWAAHGTPAMNAFLDGVDLQGKKVYIFTLQADPEKRDSKAVFQYLSKRIEEAGGSIGGTLALQGARPGKTGSADHFKSLESWDII